MNKMKKMTTNKATIKQLLDEEIESDSRFNILKGKSFEEKLDYINNLRKNEASHLTNREYALWIAYNQGISAYKKYVKKFLGDIEDKIYEIKNLMDDRNALINEFTEIVNEVNFLTHELEG